MQDYKELAKKNGITLLDSGKCQFCQAQTRRGIHECLEVLSMPLDSIYPSDKEDQIYKIYLVDAHVLQHPEIHGRWNNHLHLTRLHLIFEYKVQWYFHLTSRLSDSLNRYKVNRQEEYLCPPDVHHRGKITSSHIVDRYCNGLTVNPLLRDWAKEVYDSWSDGHETVDVIATNYLERNYS